MIRRGLRLAVLVLLSVTIFALPLLAQQKEMSPSDADPVLQAMETELERSKTALKLDQVAASYYIEYRIYDVDSYEGEAAFGAIRNTDRTRLRFLRVVVRIGDYKQDSYYGQGSGSYGIVPLEDDPIAIRHQIWDATDRAYKAAAEALTAKQALLKQLAPPDEPVDDFAHAEPVQSIGPLAKLDFDPQPWLAMLQSASAVYKDEPELESAGAMLRFQAINRYFVNSEGTVVRSGYNNFEMDIGLSAQASDGMKLERSHSYIESKIKDMPSAADFHAQAVQLAGTLKVLRNAPVVDEEYRGPVLFSADAASTVFLDFVGENILGRRPRLGQTARTVGQFASSYKTRVLPDFLSVVDDPTLASFAGQPLLGNYQIDDEGVPAAPVTVVDKGILVNYLMGREPIRGFPSSNGHGRARVPSNPAGPSVGNLIVTASESLPPAELKKKLLEICQQRDLPYGYFVGTMGPQNSLRLLHKVWVKDGHEELVRGGVLEGLDARALRSDLVAAGNDVNVENRPQNIPHSIASPSLLFDELDVKRVTTNKDKLPEYAAPDLASAK